MHCAGTKDCRAVEHTVGCERLPALAVTYPSEGAPLPSYLRTHTPRPSVPTKKEIEIARIVARVDFERCRIHDAATLTALVCEAYEAGQRDPLPLPPGPYENRL